MAGEAKSDKEVTLKLTQKKLDEKITDFFGDPYELEGKPISVRRAMFSALEVGVDPQQQKKEDDEESYLCHRLTDKIMFKSGTVELEVDDIGRLKNRIVRLKSMIGRYGTRVYGVLRDILDPPKKG